MRSLLGFLYVCFIATTAWAQERITHFDIDIGVERSGDILITETIDLISEGDQIRRGIFRELPARYTFMGVSQRYNYDLISVTRNSAPEPVVSQRNGNALVWRIGQADILIEPGPHQYEIRYRVSDAVRRHDNRAELYWNATGNDWDFPIEAATATVRFPDGSKIIDLSPYTGLRNSTASDATAQARANIAVFETTAPLPRKAGLTVSASIAPGVITPLSQARKTQLFWIRNGAPILTGLGGLILLFYYLNLWNRVGRDPQKPPVFVRYDPPKGYSPAAVHYIHHRGLRGMDALSSLLMQLGLSGVLDIEAEKKRTVIQQLKSSAKNRDADKLLNLLMRGRNGRIVLDGKTDNKFYKAVTTFHAYLAREYGTAYYKRNLGWALLGICLSIVLLLVIVLSPVAKNGLIIIGTLGFIIIVNSVFAFLLGAPTRRGTEISSEIDGFKLYLETAEKERLNMADPTGDRPPAMTVDLYERFLPYAMALGVEKPWTKQFETTRPTQAQSYQPTHIHGQAFRSGGSLGLSKTLGKTLTAGVAAAAPVSQSSGSGFSSGSGGGGFSGGGGGGGGGGGW